MRTATDRGWRFEITDRADHVRISGFVLGYPDSRSLVGATVTVPALGKQTTTKHDGWFSVYVLRGNARYAVVAEMAGYERSEMLIPARADIHCDFMLVRR